MVGVKHEYAPAGSDGSLTSHEQRAMLFCPNYLFIHPKRRRKKWGKNGNDDGGG